MHVYQAHSNSLDGLHLAGLPGSYPALSSEEEQISEEEVTTIEPPAAPMALLDLVTSDEDVEEVILGWVEGDGGEDCHVDIVALLCKRCLWWSLITGGFCLRVA